MKGHISTNEWSVVERYVSVYPSVNLCGVITWFFRDGVLASLAFASMPMSAVSGLLETYRPDALIVESYRAEGGHRAEPLFVSGVDSVWYVEPGWRTAYTKIPQKLYEGRLSPFVHRAFSIGYHALFKKGGFRMNGTLPLNELTQAWLDKHGPWKPRIRRG